MIELLRQGWAELFAVPPARRSPLAVIAWWELRRAPYNLIVGGIGLLSLVALFAIASRRGMLRPGEDVVEPLALLAAPVVLNIAYTAGWLAELALRGLTRGLLPPEFAPRLLRVGLILSLAAVLLPTVVWAAAYAAHLTRA